MLDKILTWHSLDKLQKNEKQLRNKWQKIVDNHSLSKF